MWSHEQRNAQRSDAGWVLPRDRLHGRVVGRRSVVEMARTVIVIRRSTDERRTQTRGASKRVRGLQELRIRQILCDTGVEHERLFS